MCPGACCAPYPCRVARYPSIPATVTAPCSFSFVHTLLSHPSKSLVIWFGARIRIVRVTRYRYCLFSSELLRLSAAINRLRSTAMVVVMIRATVEG